jgi:7,8-dihydropterin-6-yl-methyl-4-(beta-D-ribofuranosyl)aminobenzene 5'-phosphate synthase
MFCRLLIVILLINVLAACSARTETPTGQPLVPRTTPAPGELRLTIVYDSLAGDPQLRTDFGFAALVEYGSHTLLFDTGGTGSVLIDNLRQLNVEPRAIEVVIISHEHSDHTGGLQALLDTGARPTVYVPSSFSMPFKQQVSNQTKLVEVTDAVEIVPGVHTTRAIDSSPVEQALVVETRDGSVVITGCAHPGVIEMIRQAQAVVPGKIAYLIGGFHLSNFEMGVLPPVISAVHQLDVEKVLPAHCTGYNATALFRKEYGENFVEPGVGKMIDIPAY